MCQGILECEVLVGDPIRGGHYGQRSCEPHLKAEHMAAQTNAANLKKALANSEPSTHGTFLPWRPGQPMSVQERKAKTFARSEISV